MAKRKRLSGANPMFLDTAEPPAPSARAPIADVVGDSSASAALGEVVSEMAHARESGRLITRVALEQVKLDYLVRDRIAVDDEEMEALITSIRERGQQTPIEVVARGAGHYGLISGWRRCQAIAALKQAGEGDGTVLALLRRPESASEAYRAMVEENEIRAGLSYFERARIVQVAVEQKVFRTQKDALQKLFAAASRPRRSKIGSFVTVVEALGEVLKYPRAIGERLGLKLAKQIEATPQAAADLARDLAEKPSNSAEDEQARLTRWVADRDRAETAAQHPARPPRPTPQESTPRPGLSARYHPDRNRLELSGEALTEEMRKALMKFLQSWG